MGERPPSFSEKVPAGDNRPRRVCDECGFVEYVNPKVVVGAICTWEDKVLLCRRAIDPRRGFWTMPAGFLEEKESAEDGARREAWEEARAKLELEGLLGLYSVPRISQVHIIYRARLVSPDVVGGRGEPRGPALRLAGDPVGRPRVPERPLGPRPLPGLAGEGDVRRALESGVR